MNMNADIRCEETVLIVDDLSANRYLLSNIILELGFKVIHAADGEEAVRLFCEHRPWLVVMDIYMPIMDGIEATRHIKAHAGNEFIPVLFVTGSQSDSLVERCVDIGADDFIHRPFSRAMLHAKIKSMQRFCRLYHELHDLHAMVQREKEVAESLLSGAIEGGNVALTKILIHKQPASIFCGDIHLTAYRPSGEINVLLGDFTGHGITSIVGSLPVSETFRAMTRKGFSGGEILAQLNRKLYELLPIDMFLAAVLVTVCADEGVVYVWNCGMPDLYVFGNEDQQIKHRICSADPPLGIAIADEAYEGDVLPVELDDRIVLVSDGVTDARSLCGDMFGRHRLEKALISGWKQGGITQEVIEKLSLFVGPCVQDDDLSIIEVPCNIKAPEFNGLVRDVSARLDVEANRESIWRSTLELKGITLKQVNPVPMILSQLQEIQGIEKGWQSVFTILTELYVNALDHGVLSLDSSLKSTPHGFSRYFSERELKLQQIDQGFVKINLEYYLVSDREGILCITMYDSGIGFDYQRWLDKADQEDSETDGLMLSGRGIRLVKELAEDIKYSLNGRKVEVSYRWHHPE